MLELMDKIFVALDAFTVRLTDPIFGWLLGLHRDVALLLIAVATAFVMVIVRKWVTDQAWLKRADGDQKRLDQLLKEAKKAKDKGAVARIKMTKNMIQMRASKYEFKPTLVIIVPVLLLITWCFSRMGFESPREGEIIKLKLNVPKSEIGNLAHLVPCEGITPKNGWVQRVERDMLPQYDHPWDKGNAWLVKQTKWLYAFITRMPQEDPELALEGVAVWDISGKSQIEPYKLKLVIDDRVYDSELLIGQKKYSPEEKLIDDGKVDSIQLKMRPKRLFGVIGSIDWLFCPPWLVTYMLIAIPLFFGFKKLLNIY